MCSWSERFSGKIPVHQGQDNNLAWHYDKHGVFSVKSAYKVARADFLRNKSAGGQQGGSSGSSGSPWKHIWKLRCPNKIKHFLWHFSHNSHPLRCNLVRRGMKNLYQMPSLQSPGEDGGHLFFKCRVAKILWGLLGMKAERAELASIQMALGAVEFILKAREHKKLLMVIALWVIWMEGNIIREEGRRRSAQDLARCVELYAHENLEQSQTPVIRQRAWRSHWTKPPVDTLKLNCDASFLFDSGLGSWGALIKDSDGDPVLSGRGRMDHVLSPFHAELIACLQGIQMAVNLGISRLQVESDAQEVVKAINSDAYDMSVVGHLVDEIKSLVSSNFISFECVHVGRDCNRAAHELAALDLLCNEGEEVFTNSIPDAVMVIVANYLLANE